MEELEIIEKYKEMIEMLEDILAQRLDERDYVSISHIKQLIKEAKEILYKK